MAYKDPEKEKEYHREKARNYYHEKKARDAMKARASGYKALYEEKSGRHSNTEDDPGLVRVFDQSDDGRTSGDQYSRAGDNGKSPGPIERIDTGQGSLVQRDRGDGERGRAYQLGYGGVDKSPSGSGSNLPKRARKTVERLAATAQKVVTATELLHPKDEAAMREKLTEAFIAYFKSFDELIRATVNTHPNELVIWSNIDDEGIRILVDVRIRRAKENTIEYKAMKAFIAVYEQFAVGAILIPRFIATWNTYATLGIDISWLVRPKTGRTRKEKTLRVEHAE